MWIAMLGSRVVGVAVMLAWPTLSPARYAPPLVVAALAVPGERGAFMHPAVLAQLSMASRPQAANFLGEAASNDTRHVANWVVATGDNGNLPFIIIDKVAAKVFVFDSSGQLRGATLALMGMARGDNSVPGIGSRKLSTIRPDERITPAGRFVAVFGHDFEQDILWIDYAAAISLHRVITGLPGEHRAQRLATASPLDKRISFGCINVPVSFYNGVVRKAFPGTGGIVYILPEVKTIRDVFGIPDGSDRSIGNDAVTNTR